MALPRETDEATEPSAAPPRRGVREATSGSRDGRGASIAPDLALDEVVRHGHGRSSFRNLRTFSSLEVPIFRLYYASMLSQMAAMNMEMIARGLLVYRMTGSGTILGVMSLAQSMPMLFASLYGGVLADRLHKKYLMIFGQAASAVIALVIALAITTDFVSPGSSAGVWILIVASLFKGAVQGVMMPARQSMIPDLVGRDQIMNAMALNNLGQNLLRLLAPALAGFAIDFWGFEAIYYMMTGLFIAATLFAIPLPKTKGLEFRVSTRTFADLAGGFRYVVQEKTVGLILAFTLFAVLLSMPYMMLLPVITEDVLHVGAKGMGILISVSGIGAIIGSLVLASLPNKRRGIMLILSSLVLGVALVVFAFSTVWIVSLLVIMFVGLGQAGRMTLSSTLLQSYTEDAYRGRVMSIYMMEFGLTSLSVFFAGIVSDVFGIQWAIGGLAIVLVVVSASVLVTSPKLRRLD